MLEKLIKVKNFPNRMFAEHAQQTLEHEGISSVIQSPDAGILGAGGVAGLPQGADLYVVPELADQARSLLEALYDGI
jgi:hypothetical protein